MKSFAALVVGSAAATVALLFGRRLQRRIGQMVDGPAPPGQQPGQTVVAVLPGYWAACVLAGAIAILFLIAGVVIDDARLRWLCPAAFLLFVGAALFLFRELRRRIVLDDEGLLAQGTWQRTVRLRWVDIATVAYSPMLTSFVMRDHQGNKLRVPILARGIGTLTEQLRDRLAEPIWWRAVEEYRRATRSLRSTSAPPRM